MSLKNFHLLFISCAVLLALFVAVWAFGERVDRGNVMVVPAAAAAVTRATRLRISPRSSSAPGARMTSCGAGSTGSAN